MKSILTLILIFFWGSLTSLNAQQLYRAASAPGVQNFIIQYGDLLELTDQQKAELLTLQADRRATMRSDRQRGSMTGRQGRVGQQQRSVRGQQRSVWGQQRSVWGQQRGNMPSVSERGALQNRSVQFELRRDNLGAIRTILSDEQISKLQDLRAERIESRHELRMLSNKTIVESAISDSEKAGEVIGLLNRISEIQKENQVLRFGYDDEIDRDKMLENVAKIRSIQDELQNKITVAEYRSLRPVMSMGRAGFAGQRQRAAGRGLLRN